LAALIAAYDPFQIGRRFSNVRARLFLLKQDRVSLLEQQLEKIDRNEANVLFLGSCRRDTNSERQATLREMDTALADYGGRMPPHFEPQLTDAHRFIPGEESPNIQL